jgi:hypothetical protein
MLKRSVFIAIVVLSAAARAARAHHTEDGLLVERSEIIVVAHVKEDSIKDGPDPDCPEREAHATLVIEQVLKGSVTEREIEITLYGYLSFSVGGLNPLRKAPHYHYSRSGEIRPAAGVINLHFQCDDLLTAHLEASKIWLLQQHVQSDADIGTGGFGAAEIAEVQDPELKDYFQTYLSADPQLSVRAYVATHPQLLARARTYLEHATVQRISRIPDTTERAKRLTPYVVAHQYWSGGTEARTALAACGDAGGALLVPLFKVPSYEIYRSEITAAWGEARYKPAVDLLIDELIKCESFLGSYDQKVRLKIQDAESELNYWRSLSEITDAAKALGQIGDSRAIKALELVAKRLGDPAYVNGSVMRAQQQCSDALNLFGRKAQKNKV